MERSKDITIEELLGHFDITSADVICHDGPVFPDVCPNIDKTTAKWIDQQLEWEDAVSFAFLIVEKVDIALKLARAIEQYKLNIFQDDGNDIGIVQVIFLSAEKNSAISWQIRV